MDTLGEMLKAAREKAAAEGSTASADKAALESLKEKLTRACQDNMLAGRVDMAARCDRVTATALVAWAESQGLSARKVKKAGNDDNDGGGISEYVITARWDGEKA